MQIGKNSVVAIDYTLTNPQGEVLDTSKGRGPLTYLHGVGGLIPGLERELEGKGAGDALQVTVVPEDGYGVRDDKMIHDVPRASFQGAPELKVGMQFQAQSPQGTRIVRIVDIEGDNVKVDANHPLAGVPLHFDVNVVSVRQATPEELSHGHVHGEGGHHH
ncbi:MAG TPA: peptidylprolyl isomerase [Tepidisphaeraceae bacterium]|jgi:FKBP-type peptidyl-prolyl cis-trans isomerase SlyD